MARERPVGLKLDQPERHLSGWATLRPHNSTSLPPHAVLPDERGLRRSHRHRARWPEASQGGQGEAPPFLACPCAEVRPGRVFGRPAVGHGLLRGGCMLRWFKARVFCVEDTLLSSVRGRRKTGEPGCVEDLGRQDLLPPFFLVYGDSTSAPSRPGSWRPARDGRRSRATSLLFPAS